MRRVAHCDECEHEWIPEGEYPKRCPSRECRAVNWNQGGMQATEPGEILECEKLEREWVSGKKCFCDLPLYVQRASDSVGVRWRCEKGHSVTPRQDAL